MSNNSRLFRVHGIKGCAFSEIAAKVDHALGKTNLAKALMTFLLRNNLGGTALGTAPSSLLPRITLRGVGSIVDDLIINGLICAAERRIKDGEEA